MDQTFIFIAHTTNTQRTQLQCFAQTENPE